MNEFYSEDKGPLLVHCSAGVGRSGTFVAIDELLQRMRGGRSQNGSFSHHVNVNGEQLSSILMLNNGDSLNCSNHQHMHLDRQLSADDEYPRPASHVNIFQLVCELRYQRYSLVQSVKQYIFIYRACLEYLQFGDTEIELCHFKYQFNLLRNQKFDGNINGLMSEFDVRENCLNCVFNLI